MSDDSFDRALPSRYSRGKYQRCVQISRMPPLADYVARTWPGTTALQWAGFMSNGSGNEDTCVVRGQQFHEIGYFGITAGPCTTPYAPNTEPRPENNWLDYYQDPRVKALLGRDACMTRDCWKESNGGFSDQCAVGLVSMLAKQGQFARRVPENIKPQQLASQWSLACTFACWSAGVEGIVRHVRPFADRLAAIPEADRWNGFRRLVAEGIANGSVPVGTRKSHRTNPAYTILRTQQKIAAATEGYRDDVYDIILAKAAYGVSPSAEDIRAVRAGGALVPVVPQPSAPPADPTDTRDASALGASVAQVSGKNLAIIAGAAAVVTVGFLIFYRKDD